MKILVIFTGGTIGSAKKDGIISPEEVCSDALLNMYNQKVDDTCFVTAQPYTILSENLCGDNLNSLYSCISSFDISDFDGVIVTHGTDTLQFTSAFLGFAFEKSEKPIVVVSANYPLEDERSNGIANFTAAADFIRCGGGVGAFVAYKNKGENPKIHRATQLLAHPTFSDEVCSAHDNFYGEIVGGAFVKNQNYAESDFLPDFPHPIRLAKKSGILWLKSHVSMTYPDITPQTRAVLLEGYHSGTLNTQSDDLKSFCKRAEKYKIPVFLAGAEDGFYYESKLLFDELKIQTLPPIAPIAAYVWLWLKYSQI